MAWSSSERSSELPKDWAKLRSKVFRRDSFRCVWKNVYGERCTSAAEECDHIGDKMDHSILNLRSLCHYHHSLHTAEQAAKAKAINRARVRKKFRRSEKHPGLI